MTLPESLDGPASSPPPRRPGRSGGRLCPELLHRHLVARVAAAREQLRALDERRQAPDVLVSRFGATVADAQRVLAEERADAQARDDAMLRAARHRAEQLLVDAETEARVLRAVIAWLGQVPASPVSSPSPVAVPVQVVAPMPAAAEARAS
jgi:hypothetical protein